MEYGFIMADERTQTFDEIINSIQRELEYMKEGGLELSECFRNISDNLDGPNWIGFIFDVSGRVLFKVTMPTGGI